MKNICPNCNIRERKTQFNTSNSLNPNAIYKTYICKWCRKCSKIKYEKPYLEYRKEYCESCGFIPVNMCQLDVDHIDGNHKNNNINNLQTLCANCHRLKTFMQLHNKN